MLRVLLADDHAVVREGLRSLLVSKGLTVVGEARDGREAVQLALTLGLDVAVMDVGMPVLNGLEAARSILRRAPLTRIILLTVHTEQPYVVESLKIGVKGYVLKTQAAAELLDAIQSVIGGRTYLSPGISGSVIDAMVAGAAPPADPLSAREREVVQLISEGHTTKEVASVLGISVKTAETHRTNVMRKLNVHETAGLVRYAIRRGLTQA
jgi:DNA-binding NarL/FixJ family response regulator